MYLLYDSPMRIFYNTLLYLAFPFVLVRLLWRTRKLPANEKRRLERFGWPRPHIDTQQDIPPAETIWIHAVSAGETIAAVPLTKKLKEQRPDCRIVFTTTTQTGAERAEKLLGDTVHHTFLPYDFPCCVKRFLNRVKPHLLILVETELWPNILHYCAKRGIPVLLANARLSEQSARWYQWFAPITHSMLNSIHLIAAQTKTDADRFIALGAEPSKVQIAGSIKFDLSIPQEIVDQAKTLRKNWGDERPIWIAASTHPGEEKIILKTFKHIKQEIPQALLVLVPRHPERFDKVATLCEEAGFNLVRRSQDRPCQPDTDIFLGDSMGELLLFYAASDVAFVGGSLVPIGGHNILEPAALGVPTLTGPHMFHFEEITQRMLAAEAAEQIQDGKELANSVLVLLQDEGLRQQKGQRGINFVKENVGAVERHLNYIQEI